MAFDTEFLELMTDAVTVYALTGADNYGDPVYSTSGTAYPARISDRPKNVRNFLGEEVVASHTVWVASTSYLDSTIRTTWIDEQGNTVDPTMISMERFRDEDGIHHQKLYFGIATGGGRG